MKKTIDEYIKMNKDLKRPNANDYIKLISDDFLELSGDRLFGEDSSILGGIAEIEQQPVTIIAQMRGKTPEENVKYNYSMNKPEGYRKSLRLMKQAEKFKRPILCFVDTLGAFPGEEAEERGQAAAIANNLMEMMYLKVPVISILIGNGGSGGALALCVANEIGMLENSLLSVISPKACANILWKDTLREAEAAQYLKMTSHDLAEYYLIDEIIPESTMEVTAGNIKHYVVNCLNKYSKMSANKIVKLRYDKFRSIGIGSQV